MKITIDAEEFLNIITELLEHARENKEGPVEIDIPEYINIEPEFDYTFDDITSLELEEFDPFDNQGISET